MAAEENDLTLMYREMIQGSLRGQREYSLSFDIKRRNSKNKYDDSGLNMLMDTIRVKIHYKKTIIFDYLNQNGNECIGIFICTKWHWNTFNKIITCLKLQGSWHNPIDKDIKVDDKGVNVIITCT